MRKIDWRPNDRNTFSVDLNAMRWVSPHGIQTQAVLTSGNMLGNNGNSTVEDRYGKAAWTAVVTPNAVNELRFGWFKDRLSDPGASDLFPAETGALYITVAGSTVGAAQAYPRTYPSENRYQIVENYSWTKGAHSVKFGMDFQTTQDWTNQLFNGSGGYATATWPTSPRISAATRPALKNYTSFTQTFGNPIKSLRTTDINFYAQDTWKLSRKLTFSYGLRYEKTWLPQPTITNPDYPPDRKYPAAEQELRAARQPLVLDRRPHRDSRRLRHLLCPHPWQRCWIPCSSATASTRPRSASDRHAAGAPVFPNILSQCDRLPGRRPSRCSSPIQEFPRSVLAAGHARPRAPVHARYRGDRQLHLEPRHRDLHAARSQPRAAHGQPYTYTIQDAAGNNVGTYLDALFFVRPSPDPRYGKILQVENGGQSWYNALALAVGEALLAWLDRPGQLHLVARHRRCRLAGRKLEHLQHVQQRHVQRQLPAGQGFFHARSAPPPVHQLALEAHHSPRAPRRRQVLRERLGTLRDHHTGQRPPDRRRP